MQRVIGKEELDQKEKEVLVDFSLDYFYQELEKVIDVRKLRTMVKSLHRKVSNTKDIAFLPLIDRVLEKNLELEDNFSLFYLYDLKFDLTWLNPKNVQKSSVLLDKMFVLANKLNSKVFLASTFGSKSCLMRLIDDDKGSRHSLNEAQKIIESLSSHVKDYFYYKTSYILIAAECFIDNLEKSEKYVCECIDYFRKEGYYFATVKSMGRLLSVYLGKSFNDPQYHDKMRELIQIIENDRELIEKVDKCKEVWILHILGKGAIFLNEYNRAVVYFKRVLEVLWEEKKQDTRYSYMIGNTLSYLTMIYTFMGEFEKALEYLREYEKLLLSEEFKRNIKKRYYDYLVNVMQMNMLYIYVHKNKNVKELTEKFLQGFRGVIPNIIMFRPMVEELEYQVVQETNGVKTEETRVEKEKEKGGEWINKTFSLLLLAKALLTTGEKEKFTETVRKIQESIKNSKHVTKAMKYWAESYEYLAEYFKENKEKKTVKKLQKVENKCKSEGFRKIALEIKVYIQILKMDEVKSVNANKFQRTAFREIFEKYNEKLTRKVLIEKSKY